MKCNTCGKMNCMAHGGRVLKKHEYGDSETDAVGYKNRNKSSDMDHGQRRGPQGYPKYQEQAQNERGINRPVSGVTDFPGGKGTSRAGDYTKDRYGGKPTFEGADHPAKKEHREVLKEMKSLPKPKLKGLAHGGSVDEGPSEKANQAGVHKIVPNFDRKHNEVKHGHSEGRYGGTEEHRRVLGELMSMPKPKLKGLAHGGEVDDDKTDMYAMSPDVPAMHGMAEGGEADEMDGIDKELNEMAAGELMEALEKKDKAGILESIKAIVMNCGGKV